MGNTVTFIQQIALFYSSIDNRSQQTVIFVMNNQSLPLHENPRLHPPAFPAVLCTVILSVSKKISKANMDHYTAVKSIYEYLVICLLFPQKEYFIILFQKVSHNHVVFHTSISGLRKEFPKNIICLCN